MLQTKRKALAIQLGWVETVPVTPMPDLGDVVDIVAALTAGPLHAEASAAYVGTVAAKDDYSVTVETRFRERREDRIAAAAVSVGPFVYDASMHVVGFQADAMVSVLGDNAGPFTVWTQAATPAIGTVADPVTVVLDTSDKVKLTITGGVAQTVQLTAGVGRTIEQIKDEINAGTTDLTASVTGDGYLQLISDDIDKDLTIEDVANDAYTLLGLTKGAYQHVDGNDKFKVTVGGGAPQTFTLTPGVRTIDQIVADFAAAQDFVASKESDKLKLTNLDLADNLVIGAVTYDAYTLLGFTADTYDATNSHDPAAIAGLVIGLPDVASVTGSEKGPFEIVQGTNDTLKITCGGGAETITLTAGAARTATQVKDDINATAVSFIASVTSDERIVLTASNRFNNIVVGAVANDAYGTLGFAEGTTNASMLVTTLEK